MAVGGVRGTAGTRHRGHYAGIYFLPADHLPPR